MRFAAKIARGLARVSLVVIAAAVNAVIADAQSPGTFTRTGDMTTARAQHTATLLTTGKVLMTGGTQSGGFSGLASAELYDPKSGTFIRTGNMDAGRRMHTATLLPDGRVLIVGGYGAAGATLNSAELYDPSSGTFTAAGNMVTARGGHSAILLPNSTVLIVGGYGTNAYPNVAPAEIYDPSSGTFAAAAEYVARGGCDFCAPSVRLTDGTVLFPGQYPAQVYDPVTNSFTPAGMMKDEQSAATLLTTGKVLFAGGESDFLGRSATAELYDPDMHTFTLIASMAWRRSWHTLTLLPNGQALAAGGETDSCSGNACYFAGSLATAELYDPSATTFIRTADMAAARESHTATLLDDGRVLIAGGVTYGGIGIFGGSLGSAELYTPDTLMRSPALVSVSGSGLGQGAIFHAGTSYLAAANDPASIGELVDISCAGLDSGSAIPPQVSIGGRLAQIISFRQPGSVAGNQIRVRVPGAIAPGDAVPVRLFYLDRPSNEVTIASRSTIQ
jgi:hypothetical protein